MNNVATIMKDIMDIQHEINRLWQETPEVEATPELNELISLATSNDYTQTVHPASNKVRTVELIYNQCMEYVSDVEESDSATFEVDPRDNLFKDDRVEFLQSMDSKQILETILRLINDVDVLVLDYVAGAKKELATHHNLALIQYTLGRSEHMACGANWYSTAIYSPTTGIKSDLTIKLDNLMLTVTVRATPKLVGV